MRPLSWSEPVDPALEAGARAGKGGPGRWKGSGKAQGFILSPGDLGKFSEKNWTVYPGSRRLVSTCLGRGAELARRKLFGVWS